MTTTNKANHSVGSFADQVRRFYREHRRDNLPARRALYCARSEARYHHATAYGRKHDVLPSRYGAYAGVQETPLRCGWKLRVEFKYDDFSGAPHEDDGHDLVEVYRGYGRPGDHGEYDDWMLRYDRYDKVYYDWKAAMAVALQEEWDAPPYRTGTKHEQAMRAVRWNYEYLRRWFTDQWWYVVMTVTLLDSEGEEIDSESVGGFESDDMVMLCSEVRYMAARMLRGARRAERQAAHALRVANRFHDAMENAL